MSTSEATPGLKTPQTDPGHHVLGRLWVGYPGLVYYCDSYDPRLGYWLTNIANSSDRRNVNEKAPGATFQSIRGHWAKGDLREGIEYFSVDLLHTPCEVKPMTYDEAVAAPVNVAIFADAWDAEVSCKRANRRWLGGV